MADIPCKPEIAEQAARLKVVAEGVRSLEEEQADTSAFLADADRRLAELKARALQLLSPEEVTERTPPASQASSMEWRLPAHVSSSRSSSVGALLELPPELESAIANETESLPSTAEPMDAWDVGAAVCAGLAGAVVDFLWVRIPTDIKYLGSIDQRGSALTKWMRSLQVSDDNWLSQFVKTAFDRVRPGTYEGPPIPGLHPMQHRLLTFGHDPLLGVVFGILDTALGTMSGVDQTGKLFIRGVSDAPNAHNWALAPMVWIGHLLSDAGTKMGLPIPGWGLTQLLQIGRFGANNRSVAELARWMYMNGYDLRHYLTMGLSVAAVEVVARGYCLFRYGFDREADPGLRNGSSAYESQREFDAEVLRRGFRRQRMDARQDRILLAAHTLAAGANAVKIATYAGNPLALNVAEWARTLHALARVAGVWLASRPRMELERMVRNRTLIDEAARDLLENPIGDRPLSVRRQALLPSVVPSVEFEGAV